MVIGDRWMPVRGGRPCQMATAGGFFGETGSIFWQGVLIYSPNYMRGGDHRNYIYCSLFDNMLFPYRNMIGTIRIRTTKTT